MGTRDMTNGGWCYLNMPDLVANRQILVHIYFLNETCQQNLEANH
jgi:hypothetical protein